MSNKTIDLLGWGYPFLIWLSTLTVCRNQTRTAPCTDAAFRVAEMLQPRLLRQRVSE